MKRACIAGAAFVLLGFVGQASAHPLAPSILTLEQGEEGMVTMRWRAPMKRPTGQFLRPRVPKGCEVTVPTQREIDEEEIALTEVTQLRCTPPSLEGVVVTVDGLADSTINVVVRLVRAGGEVHHAILDTGRPALTVSTPEAESHSFSEYLKLGVEHLLTGWDHLTFVIGLLVLFGWHRRLIAAVTAFTLGHSLTLASPCWGSSAFRRRSSRP
jgi:hypothetical protein